MFELNFSQTDFRFRHKTSNQISVGETFEKDDQANKHKNNFMTCTLHAHTQCAAE